MSSNRKPGHSAHLTQDAIIEGALSRICSAGLDKFSMRSLATLLGCDPMAIYHHFKSKDELLDAVAAKLDAEGFNPEVSGDFRQDILSFAMNQLAVARQYPEAIPVFALRRSENTTTTGIKRWLKERLVMAGLDDRLGLGLVVVSINGVLLSYYSARADVSAYEDATRLMRELILASLQRLESSHRVDRAKKST